MITEIYSGELKHIEWLLRQAITLDAKLVERDFPDNWLKKYPCNSPQYDFQYYNKKGQEAFIVRATIREFSIQMWKQFKEDRSNQVHPDLICQFEDIMENIVLVDDFRQLPVQKQQEAVRIMALVKLVLETKGQFQFDLIQRINHGNAAADFLFERVE